MCSCLCQARPPRLPRLELLQLPPSPLPEFVGLDGVTPGSCRILGGGNLACLLERDGFPSAAPSGLSPVFGHPEKAGLVPGVAGPQSRWDGACSLCEPGPLTSDEVHPYLGSQELAVTVPVAASLVAEAEVTIKRLRFAGLCPGARSVPVPLWPLRSPGAPGPECEDEADGERR